ncbi:MAG: heparinase II/III family protein [Clostridia bacterium]|nr:heparinase II/III family protein [Clostridia bacterium]
MKSEFGITGNDFIKLHTFSLSDDMVLNIAREMHNGVLTVNHRLSGMNGFDLENFDWSIRYGIGTAVQFQLGLHALKPVEFLTKAFDLDGDVKHLELALRFVESWSEYESDSFNAQINPNLWNSRCAALRTENLIYFLLVGSESEFFNKTTKQLILNILRKHGRFLCDEGNYQFYSRYSVYLNRALLYLSFIFDSREADDWWKCAKERLSKEIDHCFTAEMVHIENSYMYQLTIVRLLTEIAEIFTFGNDGFGKEIIRKLDKCSDFLAHMLKPDRLMPMVGDTQSIHVPLKDYRSRTDTFAYSATGGEIGEKPTARAAVFPQAGYFVAREYWDASEGADEVTVYSDCVWTMFKSGCLSTAHKHHDDLSFMLYAKGYDVFVDSGFFSFNSKNVTRRALTNAVSHNTVIVDAESYELRSSNLSDVGLCDYVIDHPDGYSYACGFNNAYNNVSIERHFYYFGQAILIFDDIHAVSSHRYTQIFNLGEDIKVVSVSNEEALMQISKTGYYARIRQLSPTLLSSSMQSEGNISRVANKLTSTGRLSFDVNGANTCFVTLITIEDRNGNTVGLDMFDYDVQRKIFSFVNAKGADCAIKLTSNEKLQKIFVTSAREDNDFIFSAGANVTDVKFAWYVYERGISSWKLVFKTPYAPKGILQYRFEEGKNYRVKVFATSQSGEQMNVIAANISEQELVLLPQIDVDFEDMGDRFVFVNHAQQAGMLYAWYVYRQDNGEWGPIHKGVYTSENTFEYVLERGNNYRVKAFILGSNGSRRDDIVAEIEL